ncbi:MAG: 8-amino-7-oxononanoate synthase, partial [Gloeobacteraceae cyanobacterium ES-bin-144]|nr:8-amino-7-oxononanoate synthase [Verrucomicrobiales bacterium]
MSSPSTREQLDELQSRHLLRSLSTIDSAPGVRISRQGRDFWNFASNDYLGLASHPAITEAFIAGIGKYGTGSTSSRLITGTISPHTALEEKIAALKCTEAALTFTSGYTAALSIVPSIVGKGDFVVLDKLAHACLIDAARTSDATLRVFAHNSMEKLERIISKIRAGNADAKILIVTESVFSMDGDLCPLPQILSLAEAYDAQILLDEAHAIGVLGPNGMGLAEALGLQQRVHFQMGTLSKAVGLSGGYVAANRDWIDLFINRSRPFIYSTAPPPACVHAA